MNELRKFYSKNLWLWKCNMKEIKLNVYCKGDILHVFKCNWSLAFERYMRNRLAIGYYRYGPLNKQVKGQYKNIESIKKRLALYEQTGNDEILVDVANLAMVEFVNGNHPKKHFISVDDGIHSEEL